MQLDAIIEIEKNRIVLQCLRAFSDGTTQIVGGYTPTTNKKYPMPDCKARITVSTVSLENAARLVYQALELWNAATDPESKHGADKLWFVHRSHWGTAVMAGSGQQLAEVNAPLAVRQKLLWWDELVTKANARDVVADMLGQVLGCRRRGAAARRRRPAARTAALRYLTIPLADLLPHRLRVSGDRRFFHNVVTFLPIKLRAGVQCPVRCTAAPPE